MSSEDTECTQKQRTNLRSSGGGGSSWYIGSQPIERPASRQPAAHELALADIARLRLASQRLVNPLPGPVDVVRWFGAVQAQDFNAAKWAVGQRTSSATEADVGRLFDEGQILRTHVLRPTWHLVLPADIRWLLPLTAPRLRRGLIGRHRQLGIDDAQFTLAKAAFSAALAHGQHLTRPELGQVLAEAGVAPDGQRLPHFLLAAELDAVIISGPRRGKQLTYALFEERVPPGRPRDAAEAALELARRYFQSHGPAQLKDFVWWSGLPLSVARESASLAGFQCARAEDREYFDPALHQPKQGTMAHLLPNFDEYTVAYADRSAILDTPIDPAHFSYGNILSNVVTVNGRVRGAWRRAAPGIELRGLDELSPPEQAALEEAGGRMGRFLGQSAPKPLYYRRP